MMNGRENNAADIPRATLAVLFIGSLIVASFWIMLPFLTAGLWAVTIVVTTWPFMLLLQESFGGRRWLAVIVMTLMLLMVIILPFSLALATLIAKGADIAVWMKGMAAFTLPPPPAWVEGIPIAGPKAAAAWREYAALSREELSALLVPYAGKALAWFAAHAGSLGMMLVQFLLTVIICAILYAGGESAAAGVRLFARRLAGQRGEDAVLLSARAIRGVALGVVVTAVTQTAIGGTGLLVAGVPAATVLTAVMFMLCLAQAGPALVLIPSLIWLYWKNELISGTVLLVFSVVAITVDNIIRPILIRKGADLPLVMIFAGVIGGLVAFGILGLFVGPVVLAVSYTLLETWVLGAAAAEEAPAPAASEDAPGEGN